MIKRNSNYHIIYCPYIITNYAMNRIKKMVSFYGQKGYLNEFKKIHIIPQMTIPNEIRIVNSDYCVDQNIRKLKPETRKEIENLCEKYYKHYITDKSDELGMGCKYGFGQRGLSIVRYNNVPNNSIYLIWAKLNLENWEPLFPRIKRHNK